MTLKVQDLNKQIKKLINKLNKLEKDNVDLVFECEDLKREIDFLKSLLRDRGIVAEKFENRDAKLVREGVPVRLTKEMDENEVKDTIKMGEKVIAWLKKNKIKLDGEGDSNDN